jgi:hypothetical protein
MMAFEATTAVGPTPPAAAAAEAAQPDQGGQRPSAVKRKTLSSDTAASEATGSSHAQSNPHKAQKRIEGASPLLALPQSISEPTSSFTTHLLQYLSPQTSVLALLFSTASNHKSVTQWKALHECEAQAVPLVLTDNLHPKFNASARGAVVFTMFQVAATLADADKAQMNTATREMLHRAVQIMDRFIGCTTSEQDFPPDGLQAKNGLCVGLAAVSLAWKFDKCNFVDMVKALCRAAYGRSDSEDIAVVANFERSIWEQFDFNVSCVSICEFVHGYLFLVAQHLMQRFELLQHPTMAAERQRVGRQLQVLLSTRAYLQAMYLADVALFHVSVWMYYPSIFAAALLLYVQMYLRTTPTDADGAEAEATLRQDMQATLQAVTGYSAEVLKQPLVHIDAFRHIIDACPNSPLYAFFKNRDAVVQTTNGCAEIRTRYVVPYASGIDGHLERIKFLDRFTWVCRTNQPTRYPEQYDSAEFREATSSLYQPASRVLPPVLQTTASEEGATQVCRLARDFLHVINPPPPCSVATVSHVPTPPPSSAPAPSAPATAVVQQQQQQQ